ncbi:hypothetical protein VI08_17515 [Luteibacter yeojuensis]|uniref:SGNH/GDSL hydrolase family protein n=2 Tax=Luteibacter yeojuensis TaxID=345309 RepID=A0A0F3KCD3_9GAMM|nr:hypothetical protein VI08_17515 [Luteibacter yeojuensis]
MLLKLSRASALPQLAPVALAVLLLFASGAHATEPPRRVLFVGNSLTYVNNLPAATASLAPPGVEVDAFALPGASLNDDEHNARLAGLLAHGHYTDVVFQERGGDAICHGDGCLTAPYHLEVVRGSKVLAKMARDAGARLYYLGTWQLNPVMEPELVKGERDIAAAMGARYIELGETWLRLRAADPDAAWLHSDGQHPGHATTALMAVRVWHALSGERATQPPCVGGTLYYHAPSEDGFFHVDRAARPVTCLVSPAKAASFAMSVAD